MLGALLHRNPSNFKIVFLTFDVMQRNIETHDTLIELLCMREVVATFHLKRSLILVILQCNILKGDEKLEFDSKWPVFGFLGIG